MGVMMPMMPYECHSKFQYSLAAGCLEEELRLRAADDVCLKLPEINGRDEVGLCLSAMPQPASGQRSKLSSRQRGIVAVLFGTGFLLAVAKAVLLPLWFDELLTFYVSKLDGPPEIWRALERTADGNPPLLYLLTHWSHLLFGESELTTRLPSLVALIVVSGAFYFWIAERAGRAYGVLGVALLWTSRLFDYSYEARPYEWMVAWMAVALLLWRRATEPRDRRLPYLAGLAVVIACAIAGHYYAAFGLTALAAGEIVRLVRRRRADWAVWVAGAIGGASILIYLPLIQGVREAYSGGFWRPVRESDLVSFYVFFLYAPVGWALLLIYLYLLFLSRGDTSLPLSPRAMASPFLPEERAAMWVIALLPALTAIAAMLTTQAYVIRYAFPAVLGLVWIIVMMVWNSTRGAERPAWTATAITAALFFCYQGNDTFRLASKASMNTQAERIFLALDQAAPLAAPVVASSPLGYLTLWHQAPPRWRRRLLYVADPDVSLLMQGCHSADINVIRLAPWAGLSVVDRGQFLEENDRFLVLTGRPKGSLGWLNEYLDARGARPEIVIETPDFVLKAYQGLAVETQAELAALAPAEPRCE